MEAIWEGRKKWHSGLETMGKGVKFTKFHFIGFMSRKEKYSKSMESFFEATIYFGKQTMI